MGKAKKGCGCFALLLVVFMIAISREFGWIFEFIGTAIIATFAVLLGISSSIASPPDYNGGDAEVIAIYASQEPNRGGQFVLAYRDGEGNSLQKRVKARSNWKYAMPSVGRVYEIEICRFDSSIIRSDSFKPLKYESCRDPAKNETDS